MDQKFRAIRRAWEKLYELESEALAIEKEMGEDRWAAYAESRGKSSDIHRAFGDAGS